MSIEAMEQALEALIQIRTPLRVNTSLDAYYVGRAITSLRQAIAEAEKHEVSQEPVAWLTGTGELVKNTGEFFHWMVHWTPLYTHPQPKREPAADMYRNKCADGSRCLHGCHTSEKCYHDTHTQPKREWVGLTDKDIEEAYKQAEKKEPYMGAVTRKGIAEAFEQILKEKNT